MQICTRRRWPSDIVLSRWYRSISSSCTSWRRRSGSTPSTPKIILPAVMSPCTMVLGPRDGGIRGCECV